MSQELNRVWVNINKGVQMSETGRCDTEVYIKSEADKVIAELKDKCQMHDFFWEGCCFAKRGFKNTIAVSEAFDKLEAVNKFLLLQNRELCQALQVMYSKEEYDKQKYKRCLMMAKWCKRKRIDAADYRIPRGKWDFYDKWHKRWLELAEKFKDKESK